MQEFETSETLPFVDRGEAIKLFCECQHKNYSLRKVSQEGAVDKFSLLIADHMFGAGKTEFGRLIISMINNLITFPTNPKCPQDPDWIELHNFLLLKQQSASWTSFLTEIRSATVVRMF